ncbi:MAG: tRNA pseudouridine(13) synthase TruD, partial [Gammaproteobacteria bacterium]
TADMEHRLAAGEIHPTGPLPGRPGRGPSGAAAALEAEVLAPHAEVVHRLEAFGVEAGRRALRARIADFQVHVHDDTTLEVNFRLPPGSYATVFLAQAVECLDAPTRAMEQLP